MMVHIPASGHEKTSAIRLMVADQNPMNCHLLAGAVRRCRRIEVVARATTSEQVLAEAKTSRPAVALIGANLQDGPLTGFEVVRKLHNLHPELRIVLLLESDKRAWVVDAFRAGTQGIFCRNDSLSTLCRCIQSVHAGQTWASSAQIRTVLEAFAPYSAADPDR